MKLLFFLLIFLFIMQSTAMDAEAQRKITGPWLWMIAPTSPGQGGARSTDVDSLAVASGGSVTEATIAANGANAGDAVGGLVWTLGEISETGGNNINDVINKIGLGRGDLNDHSSYALITLESRRAQRVQMQVGSDDSIKVWLNGDVVHKNAVNRGAGDFQDTFHVDIKQGDNLLLVKVSERGGGWSMFVGVNADVNAVYKPPTTTLVSVDPSSIASPRIGQQFTVNVKITGGKNVAGYQLTLRFDRTALRYVRGANAGYLVRPFVNLKEVGTNEIRLIATSFDVLSQGDGTLATFTFEVLAVKTSMLTLRNVILSNAQGAPLPVNIESGQVNAPARDVPGRVLIQLTPNAYITNDNGNIIEPKGGNFSGVIPLTVTVFSKANTRMRNQTVHLTTETGHPLKGLNIATSLSAATIRTANSGNATATATLTLEETSTRTKIVDVRARVADISKTLRLVIRQTAAALFVPPFSRSVTVGDEIPIEAEVKSRNGTVMPNVDVRFIESSNLISFDVSTVPTDTDGKAIGVLRTTAAGSAQFRVEAEGLPKRRTVNMTVSEEVPEEVPEDDFEVTEEVTEEVTPARDVPDRIEIVPTSDYISGDIVEPKGGDFSGDIPLTFTVWSQANTRMRNQTLQLTTNNTIEVSLSAATIRTANSTNATATATLTLEETSTGTQTASVTARVGEISETLRFTVKQTAAALFVTSFSRSVTVGDEIPISVTVGDEIPIEAEVKSQNGTVMPNVTVGFGESSGLINFTATSVRTNVAGKARSSVRTSAAGTAQFTVSVLGVDPQTVSITIAPKISTAEIPGRIEIVPTSDYISGDIVEPKGGDFSGDIPLTFTVWSQANTRMQNQTLQLTVDSPLYTSLSATTIRTANSANATATATLTLDRTSTGVKTVVVTAKAADITGTLTLTVKQTAATLTIEGFGNRILSGDARQIAALVKSRNNTVMHNVPVRFKESSGLIAFAATEVQTRTDGRAYSLLTTGGEGKAQFSIEVSGIPEESFDLEVVTQTDIEQQHYEFSSRPGTKIWYGWQLDHYNFKKRFFFPGNIIEILDVKATVTVKGHGRLELIEDNIYYENNWIEVPIRAKEHREKPTKLRVSLQAKFKRQGAMPGAPSAQGHPVPEMTTVLPNYPNPFNPETWIPYYLAEPAEVRLTIYSADGRLVRTLALGYQLPGFYRNRNRAAYWDGRNNLGEPVASGIYFYTLRAGKFSRTHKMLVVK